MRLRRTTDDPREIAVLAVLVQRTRRENALIARRTGDLRRVGFYERKLRAIEALRRSRDLVPGRLERGVEYARRRLMKLPGIGRETADVILLHAFKARTFPADAYARRFFGVRGYESTRGCVLKYFEGTVEELEEFRALIVEFEKRYPTKRRSSGSISKASKEICLRNALETLSTKAAADTTSRG